MVSIWEAATGERMGPPLATTNPLSATALSGDAKRLLGFNGALARIWDTRRGVAIVDRVVPDGSIKYAVFSPDGHTVASFSANVVRVWDGNTGQDLFAPLKHSVQVVNIGFNSTGSRLVTCTANSGFTKCQAQLWDIATGRPLGEPLQHEDGVLCATFSPDGTRIATGSEDFTAAVWEPVTSRRVTGSPNHENQVCSVAFSPSGQLIVTASPDKSARVWNPETGDPLTPPLRHVKKLTRASFLSDNRGIVTCDEAGNSWTWTLSADQRPVQDCVSLAKLLSGETSARSIEIGRQKAESVIKSWERMRREYPADFAASADEIAAWHEFQAEISETQEEWSAAVFHLGRLLPLRPADQTIPGRLALARAHVKLAHPD
jgi:WD40 repeat protein